MAAAPVPHAFSATRAWAKSDTAETISTTASERHKRGNLIIGQHILTRSSRSTVSPTVVCKEARCDRGAYAYPNLHDFRWSGWGDFLRHLSESPDHLAGTLEQTWPAWICDTLHVCRRNNDAPIRSSRSAAHRLTADCETLGASYEYICKIRTSEPDRFILKSVHQMPGLNIWLRQKSVLIGPAAQSDHLGDCGGF